MNSYTQYQQKSGNSSRRTVVFFVIVGLHLLIGWAFVSGFGKQVALQIVKDVKVSLIKEQQVKETPPPPPKPVLDRPPPVSMPPSIVNINVPIESPIQVTHEPPPPAPPPRVTVVPGQPIKTVSMPECGEDYYPSQAKRLEQEGAVVVKFCIGPSNKIEGPVEVVTSSGFPLLDEAAAKCLNAGRYKAATQEGKPILSCKNIRVKYTLKAGN
jgi:protein TonB